jgi:aryl-alcohol dehydrogenase-like predicted oxidoreductase
MNDVPLALGTAQFGAAYGVANPRRLSAGEVDRILRTALELGITCVDTAPSYGDAESVIGRFLRNSGRSVGLRVCTKVSRLPDGLSSTDLRREVSAAVERSRASLRVDAIDYLLLHAAADLRAYGPSLVDALSEHRDAGRVRSIGLSVYDPEEADLGLAYPALTATQFPFNVFERSMVTSGAAERLRLAGHTTFARSALLQGLLTLPSDRGAEAVPGAGPWLTRFRKICAARQVQPVAASLGYVAERSQAQFLVVGVDSAEQLRSIARMLDERIDEGVLGEIDAELADVPVGVRDPRRWQLEAS